MTIDSEIQSLELDTEIELIELSNFNNSSPEIFRFCNYQGVVTGGIPYVYLPYEIKGLKYNSDGPTSRPTITISDAQRIVSAIIYYHDGIEGAKISIHRTLKMFLDGEIKANASARKPSDYFTISQKKEEIPGKYITFELSGEFDFIDEIIPRRLCSQTCTFVYRGAECSYAGSKMFTIDGKPTLETNLDECGHTVNDCQLRFGNRAELPYGGFPAKNL